MVAGQSWTVGAQLVTVYECTSVTVDVVMTCDDDSVTLGPLLEVEMLRVGMMIVVLLVTGMAELDDDGTAAVLVMGVVAGVDDVVRTSVWTDEVIVAGGADDAECE